MSVGEPIAPSADAQEPWVALEDLPSAIVDYAELGFDDLLLGIESVDEASLDRLAPVLRSIRARLSKRSDAATGDGDPRHRDRGLLFVAYASGFAKAEQALRAEAEFQATDGALEGDRYLEALGSRSGPTRYASETGELVIDGRIYARFSATPFDDGTWAVAQITSCFPPPPTGNSPGPTPA